jgi:hypothetical protein
MTRVSCVLCPVSLWPEGVLRDVQEGFLLISVVILLLLFLKHDKEIILTEGFAKNTSCHNIFMILHEMELVLCNNARPSVACLLC